MMTDQEHGRVRRLDMESGLFRFRIDAFTPATLPMKRLAEYMLELAKLMGEHEHVHFKQIKPGSAVLVNKVEEPALPRVRLRLVHSSSADAPEDLARSFRKLDTMLADDGATGTVMEVGRRTPILKFPGRERLQDVIGPIAQEGSLEGELVRVGGEDRTAHALIQDGSDTYSCEVSREMAKELGPLLYSQIRLSGRGRWIRTAAGKWVLQGFKATSFEPLSDEPLGAIIERLRSLPIERGAASVEDILRLRRG